MSPRSLFHTWSAVSHPKNTWLPVPGHDVINLLSTNQKPALAPIRAQCTTLAEHCFSKHVDHCVYITNGLIFSPNGIVFSWHFCETVEYLSILEDILARVRYPFRFPIRVRQDGCRLLEVNTIVSASSGVNRDRFINEADAIVLTSSSLHPFWHTPVGCLHARKGCARLYFHDILLETVERIHVTFFIVLLT